MKTRTIVLFIFFAMAMLPLSALAEDLHSPHVGTTSECAALWHFVHNQVPADAEGGTLTAHFEDAGTVSVAANKVLNSTQHYDVVLGAGDVLLGASDNIDGGKLVLSHVECVSPPDTTTTTVPVVTTTTAPPVTTTTAPPATTTTTAPPGTTTTSAPETTTTTAPPVTTTTAPPSPPTTELEELPETGANSALLAGLAISLMATGALLVRTFAKEES